MTAVRTFHSLGFSSVLYIFFQGAFYTILPGIDVFAVQLERAYKFDDLFDRHTPAQYTGDQFCVVPVFFVELLGQAFNGHLVAAFVLELEVITLHSVFIVILDDTTAGYRFRQNDTFLIILKTGKDFVGTSSSSPTNATHFSLLFWKRTTSASSTFGRTSTT